MADEEIMSLVPPSFAKNKFKFIFESIASACKSCRLRSACVDGLEIGRAYEVVEVNSKKRFPCPLHGEVILAKLRRAHILILLPSGLIEGVTLHYKPVECEEVSCPDFQYCRPEGVKPGDKMKIIREIGPPTSKCPRVSDFKVYEVEVS